MKIRKPNKADAKGIMLAVGMLCLLMLMHTAMYNPERLIKQSVASMGYSTGGLIIEKIDFWKGIYKASIVVTDKNGQEVEYWQITTVPYMQTAQYAKPYFGPEAEL